MVVISPPCKAITKPSLPRRVSRLPILILHPRHHHSLHDDGVLVAVHDGRLASSRSTSPKAQADYASVPSAPSAECCMHLDPTWSHSPGHLLQCSAHSQRCGAGSLAASAYDRVRPRGPISSSGSRDRGLGNGAGCDGSMPSSPTVRACSLCSFIVRRPVSIPSIILSNSQNYWAHCNQMAAR